MIETQTLPDGALNQAVSGSTASAPQERLSSPAATDFNWGLYADATMAGLAVLVPIPVLDWILEEIFRRRMPQAIAAQRGQRLRPEVAAELNKSDRSWWVTCLLLPVVGLFWLIKRISKKILYFLTVKEATDQVSLYWHQAFLIDTMLRQGHLEDEGSAQAARRAMWRVIKSTHRSPLWQLAQQIVHRSRHIVRSLLKFRRGQEDELVQANKQQMRNSWQKFQTYFEALAPLYDQAYLAEVEARVATSITNPSR